MPFFFLLSIETGEGDWGCQRPWTRGPGGTATAEARGKRRRRRGEPIPVLTLDGGGMRRRAHSGRRRWAMAAMAAALRGEGGGVRWWGELVEVESCAEAYL